MSLSGTARSLPSRCLFCRTLPVRSRSAAQIRHASTDDKPDASAPVRQRNPVLEEFRRRAEEARAKAKPQDLQGQQAPEAGDIAKSSVFEDERRLEVQQRREQGEEVDEATGKPSEKKKGRVPAHMAHVVDADPNARERWERKKVIQMIRKGGRLSKTQLIKRTEREHLARSHNFKTSTKKLGMLARQIAGKTIDDAIVQMRFSKKKVAQDVLKQLEFARDEAVVTRGMGLGQVPAAAASPSSTEVQPDAPVHIQLKDGSRHIVKDKSQIYIDQAWVGRGPYGQLPDFRARGQTNIMRTPWTSLSVILKEEKTRVREYAEREEKRKKKITGKNLWTHLPDRPVQWQRQWYTF